LAFFFSRLYKVGAVSEHPDRSVIDLFIHIGAPKTGTTAIQHFLLRHRDSLAGQGLLYPRGGILRAAHHLIGAAIYPSRVSRLNGASAQEVLATSVAEIRQEIQQRTPRAVVISTEYLWGALSPENIRQLLSPFQDMRLHVIAYLRRQDLLAQSLYVQAVKGGNVRPFDVWLQTAQDSDKGGFNFHNVLSGWRNCGLDVDVVVRVYEKAQLRGDICSDFLTTVIPDISLEGLTDIGAVNTAPDMATIELLRNVNALLEDKEIAARIRKRIIGQSPPRALFAPLAYLSPSAAEAFLERFAEDNEKVAREFLRRDDGVLFREPLSATVVQEMESSVVLERLIRLLPRLSGRAAGSRETPKPNEQAKRKKKKQRKTASLAS
jgi:hypothetical protein